MKNIVSNPALLIMPLVLAVSGCATASKESAAQISVHSAQSLAELKEASKTLFNGREVAIDANAFTESSQLLIQRKPIRTPDGQVIDTKVDEAPFILELLLKDSGCYVRNKKTGAEVLLVKAQCKAV